MKKNEINLFRKRIRAILNLPTAKRLMVGMEKSVKKLILRLKGFSVLDDFLFIELSLNSFISFRKGDVGLAPSEITELGK